MFGVLDLRNCCRRSSLHLFGSRWLNVDLLGRRGLGRWTSLIIDVGRGRASWSMFGVMDLLAINALNVARFAVDVSNWICLVVDAWT